MVNHSFHALLHFSSCWRGDLHIVQFDFTFRHHIHTLVDDTQRLTHLFDTAEISVVSVTTSSDRHVKFHFVIRVIWLRFSEVPLDTGTSQHHTTATPLHGLFSGNNSNIYCTLSPDTILC